MPTAVTAIIVQLVLAAVGSYVASRLLGIRVTWGRWIVALAAGVVLGGITAWVLAGRPLDGAGIEPDVVLVATFLITLTAVADPFGFAGPPGRLARVSAGLVRIPRLWRGIRDRLVRSRRYAQVVHIAARHGLLDQADDTATVGDPAHAAAADQRHLRRVGRALRATLEDAGGAFVKLGQVLSTRPDLLPEQITTELTGLTDDVAPSPAEQIAALLAGEYDAPPQQVFAEFDADPVSAASIAQVHHARLRTGEPVAVKVQRPQIRSVVARDLDITRRLAGAIEHRGDWGRDVGVVDLADGFAAALAEELDFTIEARNTTTCRDRLESASIVRIPAVHEAAVDRPGARARLDGRRRRACRRPPHRPTRPRPDRPRTRAADRRTAADPRRRGLPRRPAPRQRARPRRRHPRAARLRLRRAARRAPAGRASACDARDDPPRPPPAARRARRHRTAAQHRRRGPARSCARPVPRRPARRRDDTRPCPVRRPAAAHARVRARLSTPRRRGVPRTGHARRHPALPRPELQHPRPGQGGDRGPDRPRDRTRRAG